MIYLVFVSIAIFVLAEYYRSCLERGMIFEKLGNYVLKNKEYNIQVMEKADIYAQLMVSQEPDPILKYENQIKYYKTYTQTYLRSVQWWQKILGYCDYCNNFYITAFTLCFLCQFSIYNVIIINGFVFILQRIYNKWLVV